MKKMNWSSVQSGGNGGGTRLKSGAYCVMITAVNDNEGNECLEFTWDVCEGPDKGFYATEWGEKNAWVHTSKVYYGGKSEWAFKRFLDKLEESNPSFTISAWEQSCDVQWFIGKKLGIAFGTEYYVYDGKKRDRYTFPNTYSLDEVRNGEAKVPDDKYSNEYVEFVAKEQASDEEKDAIPF